MVGVQTSEWVWRSREGGLVNPPHLDSYRHRYACIDFLPGDRLGLTVRGGQEFGLGVFVTGVDKDSIAEALGLQEGDLLVSVNGKPFSNICHKEAVNYLLSCSNRLVIMYQRVGAFPCSPSEQLTSYGHWMPSERALDTLAEERSLDTLMEERSLDRLTAERSLDHLTGERSLDHLTGERSLDYLTGERSLDHLTGERSLDHRWVEADQRWVAAHERWIEGEERRWQDEDGEERWIKGGSSWCVAEYEPLDRWVEGHEADDCGSIDTAMEVQNILGSVREESSTGNKESELDMIREKGSVLLAESELNTLMYYIEDYRSRRRVIELISALKIMFDTEEKESMFTEIREIIYAKDQFTFDNYVYQGGKLFDRVMESRKGYNSNTNHHQPVPYNRHASSLQPRTAPEAQEDRHCYNYPDRLPSSSSHLRPDPASYLATEECLIKEREKRVDTLQPTVSRPNHRKVVKIPKLCPHLGIAIEGGVDTVQKVPRIINIQGRGAAFEAGGLRVGHLILEVDGYRTLGLTHEEVAKLISVNFLRKDKANLDLMVCEPRITPAQLRRSPMLPQ